jgi:hypothetical protein
MHRPINVKSPNNTNKWQMGFNLAFKGFKNNPLVHMQHSVLTKSSGSIASTGQFPTRV